MTQETLAEKVRVTPGTISRLERGESTPSIKALEQVAEVLTLDLRKLSAILCADVVGYSRLMGADEEATIETLTAYRKVFVSHI